MLRNTIRRDTLDFTQAMLRELRDLNDRPGNEFMTYLLELAYVEASDLLRDLHTAEIDRRRRRETLKAAVRLPA